jgi:hypothetical protein
MKIVKNFGLNISLTHKKAKVLNTSPALHFDVIKKQAQKDFAEYAKGNYDVNGKAPWGQRKRGNYYS